MLIKTNGHRFFKQITLSYKSLEEDVIKKSNDCEYEGDLICVSSFKKDDVPHGYGKLFNKEIHLSYKGDWKLGKFHGFGILVTVDKLYEGYFINGMRNGYGTLTLIAYGSKYVGEWCNNLRQGHGLTILSDMKIITLWDEDEPLYNEVYYNNGTIYFGKCHLNGMRNGFGILYFKNKDYISGFWENNKLNGPGYIYKYTSDCAIFHEWLNDYPIKFVKTYHY